jgi:ribonuclease P protein component
MILNPPASPFNTQDETSRRCASAEERLGVAAGQVSARTSGTGRLSMKDARLRKHADYQKAYKASRKLSSASMSWFLAVRATVGDGPGAAGKQMEWKPVHLPEIAPGPRVGLTVGKVIGKAHERNRIKRRMREVVRLHLAELPQGIDLILHPRRNVMTMDFVKLESEILRIFRQAADQVRKMRLAAARIAPELPKLDLQTPEPSRPHAS